MDEIDSNRAFIEYCDFEYYEFMSFPEFLDRYGHNYKKTTTDKV